MPSATCTACNCSDGEKAAIDQITGGDDILSNHPGVWDATAAAEQPTSGGSNAEEHLVPAGGNALKSTFQLSLCFHQLKSSSSDGKIRNLGRVRNYIALYQHLKHIFIFIKKIFNAKPRNQFLVQRRTWTFLGKRRFR